MVILKSEKLIFIHIPKTGGVSVTYELQYNMTWQDLIIGGSDFGKKMERAWGEKWGIQQHSTAVELRDLVGNEIMENYYSFAFVRHPFNRAVSYYKWAKTVVENHIEKQGWRYYARHVPLIGSRWQSGIYNWKDVNAYLNTDSFSEFIRHPNLHESIGFKPQYDFLYNKKGGADGRFCW